MNLSRRVREHLRTHPDAFGVVRPGPHPGEVVFVREAYRHIPRDALPRRIPWSVWRESVCPALAPPGTKSKGVPGIDDPAAAGTGRRVGSADGVSEAVGVRRIGDVVAATLFRLTGRQPCGGCRQRKRRLNRLPFRVHGTRIPGS